MTTFIVDCSHHDYDRGPINWTKVRAAGIDIAVAKATEGDPSGYHFVDPKFATAVSGARVAGIELMGGYHCLSHGDSASISRQVDLFLQYINQNGGVGKGWFMVDVEPFDELKQRKIEPKLSDVLAFESAWHAKTSNMPIAWYIPEWYWEEWSKPSLSGIKGPLVASKYPSTATMSYRSLYDKDGGDKGSGWAAYGGKTPAIWQYASSNSIPGITGNCDCNAYKSTVDDFKKLTTGKSAPAVVTPKWPGRVLKNTTPVMHGSDVSTWQSQMKKRGWKITVDSDYGPASAKICAEFQSEKHITADKSGQVGETTWNDAWTAKIT